MARKPYPGDVTDEEWAFVAPYLPPGHVVHQQTQRWVRAAVFDSRTLQSTPESGAHADYDGAKRRKGSKTHMAVDTPGHLLALHVTPADGQDRDEVERLAKDVQQATGENVQLAWVDQGYTGERPADATAGHGIKLEVVKLPEAERGFGQLPRRWAVERSFGWMARFRRLARDYERLAGTLAGPHLLAFVRLMLGRLFQMKCMTGSGSSVLPAKSVLTLPPLPNVVLVVHSPNQDKDKVGQGGFPPSCFTPDGRFRVDDALMFPDAIVAFGSEHGWLRYACGRNPSWKANLHAIALTLRKTREMIDLVAIAGSARTLRCASKSLSRLSRVRRNRLRPDLSPSQTSGKPLASSARFPTFRVYTFATPRWWLSALTARQQGNCIPTAPAKTVRSSACRPRGK